MAENIFDIPESQIKKMIQTLAELPPVEPKPLILPEDKETCVCGKSVPISQVHTMNTGTIIITGDVCKGCKAGKKQHAETAALVCINCKRVMMRMSPCKDPTGFEYKAGHAYHTKGCALCLPPDQKTTQIIEKAVWDSKLGKK